MKKNIAVFFGGVSCEHDISIITGMQGLLTLEKTEGLNVIPIYIDEKGSFLTSDLLKDVSKIREFKSLKHRYKKIAFLPGDDHLYETGKMRLKKLFKISGALLCNHGVNGEDGALQGLLRLSNIPFTSSEILGSSIGMDKEISKIIAKAKGINVLDFVKIKRKESGSVAEFVKDLEFPLVVKPVNLGSSIGIKLVKNQEELNEAVEVAFSFDSEILIEKAAVDFFELNISLFKIDDEIKFSNIEKPKQWHEILTFEDKYLSKGKMKGMASSQREMPAKISKELEEEVVKASKLLYETFKLSGIVRFDYIVEKDSLYFNEVNTIPGSLSNYLWQDIYKFKDLLMCSLDEAVKTYEEKRNLKYTYLSQILN